MSLAIIRQQLYAGGGNGNSVGSTRNNGLVYDNYGGGYPSQHYVFGQNRMVQIAIPTINIQNFNY